MGVARPGRGSVAVLLCISNGLGLGPLLLPLCLDPWGSSAQDFVSGPTCGRLMWSPGSPETWGPGPVVAKGQPTLCPYVDNVNVLGPSRPPVQLALESIREQLDAVGLDTHEHVSPTPNCAAVGVQYDGCRRLLRHTSRRAWRLYLALVVVLRLRRLAGWQLRTLLGHAVHNCLPMRPVLAVF